MKKFTVGFAVVLSFLNVIGAIGLFVYANHLNDKIYDVEENVVDLDLHFTLNDYMDKRRFHTVSQELSEISTDSIKKTEQISVLEESIDPKNKRWAKIKRVRKVVQDVIGERNYKDTPNIIGLTSYAAAVVDYSEAYDVPVPLIMAVTTRESAFNPKAVSHANAKGLMQLIPDTAAECAGDLGIRYYNIFKINTNVRFGTWYLWKMMDTFDNDVDLAIRAYNCGPTCVKRVLAGEYSDYPSETRRYVEVVNIWKKRYEDLGL